jgi:UDP-N-acetyl-D-galactosamine dehydrogenase
LAEGCHYDAVVLAVAHKQFSYEMIKNICNDKCVLFDVKAVLDKELVDARL